MRLTPDQLVFWQHGFFKLNATIVFTWALMLVLAVGSKLITRRLSTGIERSRWQSALEIVVLGMEEQVQHVDGHWDPLFFDHDGRPGMPLASAASFL